MNKARLFRISMTVVGVFTASLAVYEFATRKNRDRPFLTAAVLAAIVLATYLVYRGGEKPRVGGVDEFRRRRSDFAPDWWEEFFNIHKTPKQVALMAQSLTRTLANPDQAAAFAQWCKGGARIRILLLSPSNLEIPQLSTVGYEIEKPAVSAEPVMNLPQKIRYTLELIDRKLIGELGAADLRPQVRFATRDLPFSLNAVDDEMIVTFYGVGAEADKQPTMLIHREPGGAYDAFMREFEQIWNHHSKTYPYEDPVITEYRRHWPRYARLRRWETPPPPQQGIIMPTYACRANCSHCMFKSMRTEHPTGEMSAEQLDSLVGQLLEFGVPTIEITGGGEPLEHSDFPAMLEVLAALRRKHPQARFGLLSNGMNIQSDWVKPMLDVFNSYIRLTRTELAESANGFVAWRENLLALIEEKGRRGAIGPRIGVKYLLTPENADQFATLLQQHLNDPNLRALDHWRFRSDRRVPARTSAEIEQEVYRKLVAAHLSNLEHVVSLAMHKLHFPRNFRCWISPMHTVIDPALDVFLCCNFAHDRTAKRLGNLNSKSFKEIWESDAHLQRRKAIGCFNCDRDDYANCRFAELQSAFESIALAAREIDEDGAVPD